MARILAREYEKFRRTEKLNKQRFFYLKQNGRIFGPFPAAHILKLFRSNALQSEDEISIDKVNWKNALQFFKVENTAQPFELPQTQPAPEAAAENPSAENKSTQMPLASPVSCNFASMQHLLIIFAAFMLINCIMAFAIYIIATPPQAQKTSVSTNTNDSAPKSFSDFAPPADTAAQQTDNDQTAAAEKDETSASDTVRKASSAFILTLFSNTD